MPIKQPSRNPIVVVAKRSATGEVFTARKSSNGVFRVMDAGAFSKASRKASRALERDERKAK